MQLHRSRFSAMIAIATGLLALTTGCSSNGNLQASGAAQPQPSPAKASPTVPAKAVKTAPANNSKYNPKAIALSDRGVGKVAKADYKGAIQDFNQAIKLDPKLPEAYLGRGISYSGLGNRTAALKDFNQAIKLNKSFAEAYLNRADEYAAMGKKREAIADLQQASALFAKREDKPNARAAKTKIAELENPASVASTPPAPSAPSQAVANSPPPQKTASSASTSPSDPLPEASSEMALALHLKSIGAKMYGTYWCSVCHWQRDQFHEASSQVEYIECDPRGSNPQTDLCRQAGIRAFPTWEINGRLYPPGGFPLDELADIAGYRGPRNFRG
jgi:tetratricopeptide (TPR) repeat protein